jgi:non-specific serine/threonine protein kinase/serine/threonine-protein kinase
VLLADDGQAKLADFGIARESDGLVVEPTIANAVTGTPSYLAPERLRGEPASAASDVWAVGVVLYEALAGQKPYAGAAPITDLRPDVGAQLPRVIERAMAVEPAARYATAGEVLSAMRADADATLVDRTLIAEPGVVAAAPVWWRRVPGRAAVIAAGALMLMLALVAIGLAAGDDNRGAAEVTTTTVPVTTTKPTVTTVTTVPTVSVTTPSIVVVNPETPKKNRKGRRGGD